MISNDTSDSPTEMTVGVASPRLPEAVILIEHLTDELRAIYGRDGGSGSFKPEDVEGEGGAFVIARTGDGIAVGCGAIRPFENGIAEVKRMFVEPRLRGLGVGRTLIAALEAEAVRLGYRSLILETGTLQTEANALYAKTGFERCPCWGKYADDPISLCYRKDLG